MAAEAGVGRGAVSCIFQNMAYGFEEEDISNTWEWLKNHPKLHCWIDGKYVDVSTTDSSPKDTSESEEPHASESPVLEGTPFAETAIESAKVGQTKWLNINVDARHEMLFKLSKFLNSKGQFISELCNLDEENFDMIIEYFNFSADLAIEKWQSVGTVLIKLSSDTPAWVLAMHVASALSAGCSVVINPSPEACFFSFILAEVCANAGLPDGLVNVVPGNKDTYQEFLKMDIQKIIYNGYLDQEDFTGYKMPLYISVLTPNHTALILLETCDVQSALDKLFVETWKSVSKTIWGIDTLIVQESVYHEFLKALYQKIKNTPIDLEDNKVLKEMLKDTVQKGAKVVHDPDDAENMVPIVISQHHQDFGEIPITTLMTCRTAEEAAALANAAHYCIGTSVWTENCAQAMQVSALLESSIVWINTHGTVDATISFEPSRKSGLGCFGGLEGVLENRAPRPMEVIDIGEYEKPECNPEAEELVEVIRASQASFKKWKMEKSRKNYLKDIAKSLVPESMTSYTSDLNVWAHMGNSYELLKGCKKPDLHALQNKRPIGSIVMVLMDSSDPLEAFSSFVSPAIAFGNVVITVGNSDIISTLKPLIDCYRRNLPEGVVNVLEGISYAFYLATDVNIESICVCTDQKEILPEVQELKKIATLNFKRFWVQPSIERNMSEYPKRLLKEQTTFLPRAAEPSLNR